MQNLSPLPKQGKNQNTDILFNEVVSSLFKRIIFFVLVTSVWFFWVLSKERNMPTKSKKAPIFFLHRKNFIIYKEKTKKLKTDSKLTNNCHITLKMHCAQNLIKQIHTYRNSNFNLHFLINSVVSFVNYFVFPFTNLPMICFAGKCSQSELKTLTIFCGNWILNINVENMCSRIICMLYNHGKGKRYVVYVL